MCKYFISPVYTAHLGRDPNSIMVNFVTCLSQGDFVYQRPCPYLLIARAQQVAAACAGGLKKVCKQVVLKKGAASGK